MASVNQTRQHCVNQMGKTHSKSLAAQHGRGTARARHGHGILRVYRPLETISAFPYRQRETKKTLCRGGQSQDLPDTDI